MIFVLLYLAVPLSIVLGYFVPPVDWLWNCRLLLLHVIFIFGALAFPFRWMLLFAGYCGFLWDFVEIPMTNGVSELQPGWSCLAFALFGAIVNGMRPLFIQGRWEVHCLASGFCTALYLLAQYLYLSWVRGLPQFEAPVWGRIGGAGVLALFVAPIVYIILIQLLRLTGFEMREETRAAYS